VSVVPPRRLLVVPYYYPPFSGSGNRWPTLARYLRDAGHTVTVVATDAYGTLDDDNRLGVERVGDLRSSGLLRMLLRRGRRLQVGVTAVERPPGALLTRVLVPDAHVVAWLPSALFAVRRALAQSPIDVLVTSGPPESVHLLGLLLGRRRPPWIADFRDGWRFEPLRPPFPTSPQRRLDAWLEWTVARNADITLGATKPIADDLAGRLGARVAYVPNAWDPELTPDAGTAPIADTAGECRIVYTGAFSGVRGSDPEPLLRALATVRADAAVRPIRLVLAGPQSDAERSLIERTGNGDAVSHVGILPRRDALALQRSADALLLLTSRNSSEATGKLYEYIGAGRPVLALAEGNEAERIVRETGIGITVPPDDADAIAAALRRVASGQIAESYAPRNLDRFTYPGPAIAVAELVEEAIEVHRRRERR
jgi:glycosyltransferase involved in cell wall biosynthesis